MMMNKLWLQLLSFSGFNEESYVPDNRKSMSVVGSNVRPLFIPSFLSFSFHFFLPVYHFLNGSNPQN